ncbi:putative mannitol dehydrogenase [Heracleum sosnowskyi]|uniref:Mannitol dehydrogenase n=1 Tax=Heracleum sosnowskyi TaxID=360622 RepID=A0AAD8I9P1_9APIA|nr:putative mannitol dehydrogenase [Heracleum sosnowskyi]
MAKAFGAHVTVISTSEGKRKEATEKLGDDSFLVSRDPEQLKGALGSMDGIIDTVSADHPMVHLLGLLKADGKLFLVGLPNKPMEVPAFPLVMAKHNITADVEVIPVDYVNTAMERLIKSDDRYRFVIDVGNTLKAE